MSAKKPHYKPRTCYVEGQDGPLLYTSKNRYLDSPIRVRVVDARELTPEKAVEKVLQWIYNDLVYQNCGDYAIKELAGIVGMSGTVLNGKVRVRKIKESKR
jgi:hypothetical protein